MPSAGQYQRYIEHTKNRIQKLSDLQKDLTAQKKEATNPAKKSKIVKKLSETKLAMDEAKTKKKEHEANLEVSVKSEATTAKSKPVKALAKRGRPAKVSAPAISDVEVTVKKAPKKRGRPAKASSNATATVAPSKSVSLTALEENILAQGKSLALISKAIEGLANDKSLAELIGNLTESIEACSTKLDKVINMMQPCEMDEEPETESSTKDE